MQCKSDIIHMQVTYLFTYITVTETLKWLISLYKILTSIIAHSHNFSLC